MIAEKVFIVSRYQDELDKMQHKLIALRIVDRMPTRILVGAPQDWIDRQFRGVRSGVIFLTSDVEHWKPPAIYTQGRDFTTFVMHV